MSFGIPVSSGVSPEEQVTSEQVTLPSTDEQMEMNFDEAESTTQDTHVVSPHVAERESRFDARIRAMAERAESVEEQSILPRKERAPFTRTERPLNTFISGVYDLPHEVIDDPPLPDVENSE